MRAALHLALAACFLALPALAAPLQERPAPPEAGFVDADYALRLAPASIEWVAVPPVDRGQDGQYGLGQLISASAAVDVSAFPREGFTLDAIAEQVVPEVASNLETECEEKTRRQVEGWSSPALDVVVGPSEAGIDFVVARRLVLRGEFVYEFTMASEGGAAEALRRLDEALSLVEFTGESPAGRTALPVPADDAGRSWLRTRGETLDHIFGLAVRPHGAWRAMGTAELRSLSYDSSAGLLDDVAARMFTMTVVHLAAPVDVDDPSAGRMWIDIESLGLEPMPVRDGKRAVPMPVAEGLTGELSLFRVRGGGASLARLAVEMEGVGGVLDVTFFGGASREEMVAAMEDVVAKGLRVATSEERRAAKQRARAEFDEGDWVRRRRGMRGAVARDYQRPFTWTAPSDLWLVAGPAKAQVFKQTMRLMAHEARAGHQFIVTARRGRRMTPMDAFEWVLEDEFGIELEDAGAPRPEEGDLGGRPCLVGRFTPPWAPGKIVAVAATAHGGTAYSCICIGPESEAATMAEAFSALEIPEEAPPQAWIDGDRFRDALFGVSVALPDGTWSFGDATSARGEFRPTTFCTLERKEESVVVRLTDLEGEDPDLVAARAGALAEAVQGLVSESGWRTERWAGRDWLVASGTREGAPETHAFALRGRGLLHLLHRGGGDVGAAMEAVAAGVTAQR